MKNTTRKAKKSTPVAEAMHIKHKDGKHHIVGISNLRVMIVPDDGCWFAQGLEIDYAVQGSSVADVKRKFQKGLAATIHHNLDIFGKIDNMLRVAPNEAWIALWNIAKSKSATLDQVSMHEIAPKLKEFPYQSICYQEFLPAA